MGLPDIPMDPPPRPAAAPAPQPEEAPPPAIDAMARRKILDDPKLNGVLSAIPGATVIDIKEARK